MNNFSNNFFYGALSGDIDMPDEFIIDRLKNDELVLISMQDEKDTYSDSDGNSGTEGPYMNETTLEFKQN